MMAFVKSTLLDSSLWECWDKEGEGDLYQLSGVSLQLMISLEGDSTSKCYVIVQSMTSMSVLIMLLETLLLSFSIQVVGSLRLWSLGLVG